MQPYMTIGVKDADEAYAFYDAALATVGWSSHVSFPGWRAYSAGGTGEGFTIWVCQPFDGQPASAGNGTMLGLPADSREVVEAFHAAAMAHGGTDEGAPGHRTHYGPNWFAAYVRDPSGNKIGAIFNG